MPVVNQYRVWCVTEAAWVYVWGTVEPTVCPNNVGHTITTSKTAIVAKEGTDLLKRSDGRVVFQPQTFDEGVYLYMCGRGDHASNGRGEGTAMQAERSTDGDTTVEWSFNDWVKITGGYCKYSGAVLGDEISFSMHAPASTVVANGSNLGNCNLVATGLGFNIITPAAGNGTHDVDLDAHEGIPVPNAAGTGYWDWDVPDTGKGEVTPNATGTGAYDLYDAQMELSRHAARMQLVGADHYSMLVDGVKPSLVLPHWTWKVVLHNEGGSHTLTAIWHMVVCRSKTTKLG